jgi:hypothetical protein
VLVQRQNGLFPGMQPMTEARLRRCMLEDEEQHHAPHDSSDRRVVTTGTSLVATLPPVAPVTGVPVRVTGVARVDSDLRWGCKCPGGRCVKAARRQAQRVSGKPSRSGTADASFSNSDSHGTPCPLVLQVAGRHG